MGEVIFLTHKCLLSIYCAPDFVLGIEDPAGNEIKTPALIELIGQIENEQDK